jgi:hypothetical protein
MSSSHFSVFGFTSSLLKHIFSGKGNFSQGLDHKIQFWVIFCSENVNNLKCQQDFVKFKMNYEQEINKTTYSAIFNLTFKEFTNSLTSSNPPEIS